MNVITQNLLSFVAGIGVGYVLTVVFLIAELRAMHQEITVTERNHAKRRIARVLAAVAAAASVLAGAHLALNWDQLQPLWDFSRAVNGLIGPIVLVFLLARLIPMLLDPTRWRDRRALHLLGWFAWIAFSIVNATAAGWVTDGTPNWTSGGRLLLNLAAIALCAWWPHPRTYTPLERGGPR